MGVGALVAVGAVGELLEPPQAVADNPNTSKQTARRRVVNIGIGATIQKANSGCEISPYQLLDGQNGDSEGADDGTQQTDE